MVHYYTIKNRILVGKFFVAFVNNFEKVNGYIVDSDYMSSFDFETADF